MKTYLIATVSALALSAMPALSQDKDIQPETLTVQERIPEGPHVYVMDFGINGSSPIYVLDADDLSLVGSIGTGTFAQMMMTPDKSALYSASVYLRRYTYGDVEAVIHEWDPQTLQMRREVMVSDKIAQALSQRGIINLSADGKYMVVQNATPATSVDIVDMAAGKPLVEIPTPGCWTAYPSVEGTAFTTLCGDGTIAKYSYGADGSFGQGAKSDKIFDPDTTPLFGDAHRVDGKLVYVSYTGSLFVIDDSGDKPVLSAEHKFAEEGWAPSGYNLMAYHQPSNTMFVLMHANPSDGSHKMPAEEIWAVSMADGKVVGRSKAHGESSITVSQDDKPVLVGIDHLGGVHRYDAEMGDTVTLTETKAREQVATFPTIVATDF
ncbi:MULTISPECIES: amine dehydrogenase large subunit [unclassified Paracoccus (in: a-proteobacteria)]|uniref:amine dehydrogenase large subunit n=1 Tax=unclassified Paracoccus (in: a-proteobacteria) TaxID=2688777 RepID=UPI0018A6C17F|nr:MULTISPECIES: amine dehydrogenase large subunit [unclassified Paracoccus (in: a-proteobacteria)]UXU76526.1 hypothetical protein GB879_014210 [Paracoccus sp. SMMA_5]UXU82407.1 hypothetical protein GB880_014225 [Paracoccus sp. SMMA_5_TC]